MLVIKADTRERRIGRNGRSPDRDWSSVPKRPDGTGMRIGPRRLRIRRHDVRTFSTTYKRWIVREFGKCTMPGELGALLRREGV